MVGDLSDVFLDSVCKHFIENFCIQVHKGNCSVILSLFGSLYDLNIRVIVSFYWDNVPYESIFWNSLRNIN